MIEYLVIKSNGTDFSIEDELGRTIPIGQTTQSYLKIPQEEILTLDFVEDFINDQVKEETNIEFKNLEKKLQKKDDELKELKNQPHNSRRKKKSSNNKRRGKR